MTDIMRAHGYLFAGGELSGFLASRTQEAGQRIDAIPRDQFLASPEDDLVAHVASLYALDPLAIYEDRMIQEQREVAIDVGPRSAGFPGQPYRVHGVRVMILLPFSGEVGLWSLCPGSRIVGNAPRGQVVPDPQANYTGLVEIMIDHPLHEEMGRAKQELDQNLHLLREYLRFQRADVDHYNRQLPDKLLERVKARRERLTIQDRLADLIAIPLARNADAPCFKALPIQKRIVTPLPPPPKEGYKPELGIADQHYDDILSIIRHVARTFEATPRTYAVHGEEELRDILLAHLNGHYKGLATGETFRGLGKTDIRIEAENRAAFIAECKIWKGPVIIGESLDQLLGYLTWRDCKTALVLFNKEVAGFSDLLGKVQPKVESHPRFMKTVQALPGGEWRFVLRSREDEARLVHVHVFLINIFTA